MLLAAGNLTTALYLLGMMLIILAVLRGTKKNMKAAKLRSAQPSDTCDDTLELRPFSDKPAQLMRWEVEMHELARDISAKLDNKIAMLQQLMIAAEAQQLNLNRALTASRVSAARPPMPTADENLEPQILRRDRLSEIYRMADEGYPTREIADQIHSSVGDVELILSLPRA
jgi:hypothetical protein